MNLAEQVESKLIELDTALNEKLPNMPILLKEIHTQLKKDPEVVTILTEEQIAVLVRGLDKQTNTELAASVLKAAKTGTKAMSKMQLDDI